MKNRLIYILISLMVVALFGSITIQSIWILDAADKKKEELRLHTNDALNKVNQRIDEKEAQLFLDLNFGGLDSLVKDVLFIEKSESGKQSEHIIIDGRGAKGRQVVIEINQDTIVGSLNYEKSVEISNDSSSQTIEIKELHNNLLLKMKQVHHKLDSSNTWTTDVDTKMKHVTSIVEHFTYETMLNGGLTDRISASELEILIKQSLEDKGVNSEWEYAIYDKHEDFYVEGYGTQSFDSKAEFYEKSLFPNDKKAKSSLFLQVQLKSPENYIWKGIQSMIWLSVLFTSLILIAFGYSLYFIFKQKKISQIKNDFINNMTHELKTPLASISLATASIRHPEVIKSSSQITTFLDIIEAEKSRINMHVEKVLDIASLDRKELKLNHEKNDFLRIVECAIENVKLQMDQVNGVIEFNSELSEAFVLADEFHLINAITNVFDNSIKYRKEELKVVVSLRLENNNYVLSIKDNGIGVSNEVQKHAFDKFYRAETGNIHNSKGFGLGLSYVKGIIEMHKGEVELAGKIGQGTTVVIKLRPQID